MPCIVRDLVVSFDQNNAPVPIKYAKILVDASKTPLFIESQSSFLELGPIPQRVIASGLDGVWTVTLPWPSEQDPSNNQWLITLPDNSRWMGFIPEAVAGPLSLHDLKQQYGWGLVSATNQDFVPVAIQGPPGGNLGAFSTANLPYPLPAAAVIAFDTTTKLMAVSGGTNTFWYEDGTPVGPSPTVGFSPTHGFVGDDVTITGRGFSFASAVTFNGTSATYSVESDTTIIATVPMGASDGLIAVTNPVGTGTSQGSFTVDV